MLTSTKRSRPKIQRVGITIEKYRKMVTYYNKKDLASFGEYLLSDQRKELFEQSYNQALKDGINSPQPVDEALKSVHHADIENWLKSK